jgi:hypothetical protein
MLAAREPARNDPRDPGNYNVGFHDNRSLSGWWNRRLSPYGSVRQILLALDSNSCHNIIKLEQKFPVRNARKANWCNCFTALKAFQVIQDLPCGKRPLVVSLRNAGDG